MRSYRAVGPLLLATTLFAALPAQAAPQMLGGMSSNTTNPVSAKGAPDFSIAAVVGDEAISSYDVANRIKFIIATARISDTPDVLKVIRPQVIKSLVDEKLEVQEAKKNKIVITPKDLSDAIASIESDRGMPPGTIYSMLDQNNVPKESFENQIRAQLMWNHLLMSKIRPTVHISDEELQAATRKFSLSPPPQKKEANGPQEYKIAVIALPVEKVTQEKPVHALAFKLVQQIRGGASFEEVSRQFSSVAANAGGVVESFWIRPSQLDPAIAHELGLAKKGDVTDPVRTSQGYTVIKVYDTRAIGGAKAAPAPKQEEEPKDTEVTLKEILLKMKPDAAREEGDVTLQIGADVAKAPGTCDEKAIANIADAKDMDIEVKYNSYMLSEMPPALKALTDKMKQGEITSPMATYEGIRLYMLCGRKEATTRPVNKDLVYATLIQQKMDLEAQKYLRNLRRETFIDVRQ